MATTVGTKGQVVIEKRIRDRFGIEPGWQAVQIAAADHVALYFIPPEHADSLLGAARPFITRRPAPGEDWDEAVLREAADTFRQKQPES